VVNIYEFLTSKLLVGTNDMWLGGSLSNDFNHSCVITKMK
jgi:hypothetical protein